ncbi:MAG: hypothetical protein JRH07_16435 [Deltaproteobacteria bacterium]|nr:hypothetical protein [Deltaproteobacteria bacterium]MBW2123411.1 hypothetical protein [Deltaproteobacteria bacterium]
MARYARVQIPQETPAQTRWEMIRDKLVTNQSVEVVKIQDSEGTITFELRAWTGVRHDGSNGPDAMPGNDY